MNASSKMFAMFIVVENLTETFRKLLKTLHTFLNFSRILKCSFQNVVHVRKLDTGIPKTAQNFANNLQLFNTFRVFYSLKT